MTRQWRICFPGALYHVMSRGNGRQDIFLSDDDRYEFLRLLEAFSDRFDVRVCAYVLMNNHYHLLLQTIEPNLSWSMQWFGTTYTRKFNIHNHTGGHLFQGRYKSVIVENDAYLLRLSCYIHRNPLRAGIVDRLSEYKWSSYHYYAYKKKAPPWLHTQKIFSQISGDDVHRAYRRMVQQYAKEEDSFLEDLKHGLIYGSQEFIEEIKDRFLPQDKNAELPQQNSLLREVDIDSILKNASKALNIDMASIKVAKRISAGEKADRDLLIYLIWKTGRLSNYEIGAHFGLTYSAISQCVKAVNDRIAREKKFGDKYQTLKSQFKV